MENLIIKQFEAWEIAYNNTDDTERKSLIHQRMVGFIIGLELSGKNIEANNCKQIYEQMSK